MTKLRRAKMSLQKTVEFRTAVAGLGMHGLGAVPVHHAAPFFFEQSADPAQHARFEAAPVWKFRSVLASTLRDWPLWAARARSWRILSLRASALGAS
jgi:hypothetical protein